MRYTFNFELDDNDPVVSTTRNNTCRCRLYLSHIELYLSVITLSLSSKISNVHQSVNIPNGY